MTAQTKRQNAARDGVDWSTICWQGTPLQSPAARPGPTAYARKSEKVVAWQLSRKCLLSKMLPPDLVIHIAGLVNKD